MSTFLTISHVVICLVLIGVVLLQSGREGGGDIGGGGGGGIKPVQSGNKFMERLTSTMAVVFMITSIVLAAQGAGTSVMSDDKKEPAEAVGGAAPADGTTNEVKIDQPPAGESAPGTEPAKKAEAADKPAAAPADKAAPAEPEAKDEPKE